MTPGWDIEYTTAAGVRHVYEVKGTDRQAFESIDISANEWRAAQSERELYHLVLVTSVRSSNPRIAIIDDPYGCWQRNELTAEETAYRLVRETDETAEV